MIQSGILSTHINHAANKSDTILDWHAKFGKLITAKVLLEQSLELLELPLQKLSAHCCGQVELIIRDDFTTFECLDFHLAMLVVEAWDAVNSCVESLAADTLRLAIVHVGTH